MYGMRVKNTKSRFEYDHQSGYHDEDALYKNREKLHFSVAIRVVFVAGLGRKIDAKKSKSACQNVDDAFGGIG